MAPGTVFAQGSCVPLPVPTGDIIELSPAQAASLPAVVTGARPGATIQLTDGTYVLSQTLVFNQPGVTIRSKSGNRNAVTLDGQYAVGELVLVMESNITVADLTLTRAFDHLVHVAPDRRTTSGTLIHNVRGVDSAQQFVKINQNNGFYADNGVVRCSSFEMTDTGRAQVRDNCYTGGIGAHQAQGWQIYLNDFNGFWCSAGLSGPAIQFWMGSRDTTVDRNVIINSARGVGLGLGASWPVFRSYPDQPCDAKTGLGHYGGTITNTVIFANDPRLFESGAGFDSGITLEQSCATNVLHNTVFSTTPPFSSIEWRWPNTLATIANNIVSHNLRERDGGVATLAGNLTNAPSSLFVDAVTGGDLHLRLTAVAAIDKGAILTPPLAWDIDAAPRDSRPDVGADEFGGDTSSPPEGSCTPSAGAIRGSQVCDSSGALWTLGPWGETMRNGIHTGGGYGSVYSSQVVNSVLIVSTLGLDNTWWTWSVTAWVRAGADEPGTTTSACTPSPAVTRGSAVCDTNATLWTLGPHGETLRNGVHTGGGHGWEYSWQIVNGVLSLSTLGRDDAWWSWSGTGWQSAGETEPGKLECAASPSGFQAGEVCDSEGARWTLGAFGETLRNGIHVGGGYGSAYWWGTLDSMLVVSTRGLDDAWWTWDGSAWVRSAY